MKNDLRQICRREIERINKLSEAGPLDREEIEKLKGLATSLKTLEDSNTPEEDGVSAVLKTASMDDIYKVLEETSEDT